MNKAFALFVILTLSVSGVSVAISIPQPKTPIQHLVFIVQENQTFDHFFGTFPGLAKGFAVNLNKCMPTPSYDRSKLGYPTCIKPFNSDAIANFTQGVDLNHAYASAHAAYNNGKMNKFINAQGRNAWGNLTMSYLTGATLPNWWDYASYYALDANFFSSSMSYSYPNHLFTVAPAIPSDCAVLYCLPRYNLTLPNIVQAMNATGVDWTYFSGGWNDKYQCAPTDGNALPTERAYWNILPDWPSIQTGQSTCHRLQNLVDLNRDIGNGYLPQVSWVTPAINESDHPGCSLKATGDTCTTPSSPLPAGQIYVSNLVNKISQNPTLWGSTAIFITWDDWGGYYDGVIPHQVDQFGYGFREPLIVVSPYVKPGIYYGPSSSQQDFTSFLATIEYNWNLPAVGTRDGTVGNLFYMFDFKESPLPPLILPSNVLATYPLSTCTLCHYGSSSSVYAATVGLKLPQDNSSGFGCLAINDEGDPCD